ncbi:MAG: hypothetical protein R3F53_26925 [Gammaproteobacteria bacterium]
MSFPTDNSRATSQRQLFLVLLDGDRFESCFRYGIRMGNVTDLM